MIRIIPNTSGDTSKTIKDTNKVNWRSKLEFFLEKFSF